LHSNVICTLPVTSRIQKTGPELQFLDALLQEGRLLVGQESAWEPSAADVAALKAALLVQSVQLAGPPLAGCLDTTRAALQVLYRLAWRFLNSEPTPVGDDHFLRMPAAPRTPAQHLGADLAFRFLPGLLQRALHRNAMDELAEVMKRLLRQWPLSGVLADLVEPPDVDIDFGHIGLGFLYAERLAARDRPGWQPKGESLACAELVWHALGKAWPPVDIANDTTADTEVTA